MNDEIIKEIGEDIELAKERLSSAKYNLGERALRVAVSDIYYTCFHSLRALLLTRGTRFQTHKGVLNGFNQYFIKGGLAPKDMGQFLNRLAKARTEADYKYRKFETDEVLEFLDGAEKFEQFALDYLTQFTDWVMEYRPPEGFFRSFQERWDATPVLQEHWIYDGAFHRRSPSEAGLPSQITVTIYGEGIIRCRYPKRSVLLALRESGKEEALDYFKATLIDIYDSINAPLPENWMDYVIVSVQPRFAVTDT
jgi:hypothetical protein